ncbi:MAG: hypothetical protein AAF327_08320 [Cyanobacteria bacterium P01_A01_bin.37]
MIPHSQEQIDTIAADFPGLPQDYVAWLRTVCSGHHDNGFIIDDTPIMGNTLLPDVVQRLPALNHIRLIADDMAGDMIGYQRTQARLQIVGVESCDWTVEEYSETFTEYMNSLELDDEDNDLDMNPQTAS